MRERKTLLRTLIASVLVHVAIVLWLPGLKAVTPRQVETRVQLSLTPPPDRSGTFTETPESARTPEAPDDASHLAEHNARAQNPEPAPEIDGRPRHTGDLELFDFRASDLLNEEARERQPTPPTPVPPEPQTAEQRPAERPEAAGEAASTPTPTKPGAGDVMLAQAQDDNEHRDRPDAAAATPRAPASGEQTPRPRHDAPVSGVAATGELSLSTYAWAWAPYLRHLRDTINERWHPPMAFYMGLIEGDGSIRFRVYPDGSVSSITLITEVGHPSLARAARNAVTNAAPFRPLPDDFPDPHLDVTWHYRYVLVRR